MRWGGREEGDSGEEVEGREYGKENREKREGEVRMGIGNWCGGGIKRGGLKVQKN